MGNNPAMYSDPDGDFIAQLVGGVVGAGLNVWNNWDKILANPVSAFGYAGTGAVAGVVATLPGGIGASRAILAGGNVATDIASGNMPNFSNFGEAATYAAGTAMDAFSTAGASKALGKLAQQSLKQATKQGVKEILEEGAFNLLGDGELAEMTAQWYGQEVGQNVFVEITANTINWGGRAAGSFGLGAISSTLGISNRPQLPDKTIVNQDGVKMEHNYRSNDHEPAHAHVKGNGPNTRIDRLGNPVDNTDLPMSKAQRKVYKSNKSKINRKLRKIGKWLKFK